MEGPLEQGLAHPAARRPRSRHGAASQLDSRSGGPPSAPHFLPGQPRPTPQPGEPGSAEGSGRRPRGSKRGSRGRQEQQQEAQKGPNPNAGIAAAAATAAAAAAGLTWQQQQMLSASAAPFVPPAHQQQQHVQHPQATGPQAPLMHRQRSRRRGKPPGAGGRDGSGAGPAAPAPGLSLAASVQDGLPGQQQQPEPPRQRPQPRQERFGSAGSGEEGAASQQRQRRRERGTRPQQQQPGQPGQPEEGAGAGQRRALEAAASAAANRAQQWEQEQDPGQQSGEGEEEQEEGLSAAGRAVGDRQLAAAADRQEQAVAAAAAAALADAAAQPAAQPQAGGPRGGGPPPAEQPEAPHCLVCCSPMAEVGMGQCNHKDVCGQCTLRLRLCYGRHDCPACRAELKEVIIAPWRPTLPDWEEYQAHPDWVARTTKWARGEILADRWRRGGRLSSRLMHDLQRRTSLACCVCDPSGEAPFQRREHLLRHVEEAHGRRLCGLCLQETRLFPLELQAFSGPEALQAHTQATHPHCQFCRRTFFDDDALWKHMHQVHYTCHVCPPPVAALAYFNRAPDLLAHMREEHFMCEEPECADCFVAFETGEELRRHHLERHSARMPRWDSSRARPLQLDISYTRRGAPLPAADRQPGQAQGQGQQRGARRGARGSQDVRVMDGEPGREQQAARGDWPAEYEREADGGLMIIDDAEFPSAAAAYPVGGPGGARGGAGLLPASWAERQRGQRGSGSGGEEFPSLAVAAAVEAASSSTAIGAAAAGVAGGGSTGASKPPPLVKKTAKCPCGRRVSHYAVAEGQEVPPLECDAVCKLEGRRQQLADAFGVGDPAHHASSFDSHRNATYSGMLLAAAQQHPLFIQGLEKELATFIADKASKRTSLSAMPRGQRQVVHALAEQYGLATSAYGQEPARYIELFKTPTAGIPARLLSRVAPTVPAEEVTALLREAEGFAMRITDIALSVDIRFYLRQWEGQYTLEWQGGDAAVVRFQREADLKEALDMLGGGIRGLFRIDRSWRPKTAVAAVPATSGPGASRGWGGAEGGAGSSTTGGAGGADSSSWTAVAVAPRHEMAQRRQQAQQPEAAAGAPSSSSGASGELAAAAGAGRWAVMTGRRPAPASRTVTPAGTAGSSFSSWGSRNVLAEATPELADVHTDDDE